MNQTEMQEKVNNLIKDEEYMKHLLSLGSAEAISKELEKEDIALSPDELRMIYSLLIKKQNGELTDEDLEKVSGGIAPMVASLLGISGAAAGIGLLIGAAVWIYSCATK